MTINKDELAEIIKKHEMWLSGLYDGEQANLACANLACANLACANLTWANLAGANLGCANLAGANLAGADLEGVDITGANLTWANLAGANLRCANLAGANLTLANLTWADLTGANGIFFPLACPDTGAFVGWKKVENSLIVKLEIPEDARRSSAAGRKCRCDKAKVLAIENIDGTLSDCNTAVSIYDKSFTYVVGKTVAVPDFCEDRWNECASGIHFFINRQEAVNYNS